MMCGKHISVVCIVIAAFTQLAATTAIANAAELNACDLLTSEDIATVLVLHVHEGVSDNAGLESNGAFSSTCFWRIDSEEFWPKETQRQTSAASFAILHVMTWPVNSNGAGQYLQAFRDAAVSGDIPAVPEPRDFGDEALWWGDGLAVRSGNTSFGISVHLPGSQFDRPGAFEEQLARSILQRLREYRLEAIDQST